MDELHAALAARVEVLWALVLDDLRVAVAAFPYEEGAAAARAALVRARRGCGMALCAGGPDPRFLRALELERTLWACLESAEPPAEEPAAPPAPAAPPSAGAPGAAPPPPPPVVGGLTISVGGKKYIIASNGT